MILDKAKAVGHIHGVASSIVLGGLTHLQYADDSLIFVQNRPEEIVNLKFLLMCFEAMSGLKINFEKNEAIVTGGDFQEQLRDAHMMNCKLGSITLKYLGMPISDRTLSIMDCDPKVEKVC